MIFRKSQPLINKGGFHYEYYIWSSEAVLMVRQVRSTFEFDQPYKQAESKMQLTEKI